MSQLSERQATHPHRGPERHCMGRIEVAHTHALPSPKVDHRCSSGKSKFVAGEDAEKSAKPRSG